MSETNAAAENFQKWTKQILGDKQGRQALGEQTERFWSTEDEFVDDVHDYVEGWCERRHAAAKAAIEFGHLMANGGDQGDVVKAWSNLSVSAMKRFAEDAQGQFSLVQKMALKMAPNGAALAFPMVVAEEEKAAKSTSRAD